MANQKLSAKKLCRSLQEKGIKMQLMVLGKHTNVLQSFTSSKRTLSDSQLLFDAFFFPLLSVWSACKNQGGNTIKKNFSQFHQSWVLRYTNMLRGWEIRQPGNPPSTERISLLFTSLVRLRFDSQGFSYLQLTYILGVCQDLRRRGLHESLSAPPPTLVLLCHPAVVDMPLILH